MTTAVRVTVTPAQLTLRPGDTGEVEVSVQNASRAIEHYRTTVVGLPSDELYSCQPEVVKLRPGESGSSTVQITVPERAGPDAGRYILGVLVRSPYQREVSRCEELAVDVMPAPALSMTAAPEIIVGGPQASYTVTLTNEGNVPLAVTLEGSDPEHRASFAFQPRTLHLDPAARGHGQLTVRAPAPWTGQEVRRQLSVQASAGPEVSATKTLTFNQRPRIPAGPFRVIGIAAAVTVLAGAILAGALINKARQEAAKERQNAAAATQQANPNANGASQAGPGASATASAGASANASANPSANASGSGSAAPLPPGTSKYVDFTQRPDGKPAGDGIIPGDLYTASGGITLSTVTEQAPADCKDATAVALRTVSGVGAFLTSARPAGADLCNTLPVKIVFSAPVKAVRLDFAGRGAGYRMILQGTDGSQATKAGASQQGGAVVMLSYDVPAGAKPVQSVVFGHASTAQTAKDPTIIKHVTYVLA